MESETNQGLQGVLFLPYQLSVSWGLYFSNNEKNGEVDFWEALLRK